jgi:hypothetical protein
MLEGGVVVADGQYVELMQNSSAFKLLAGVGSDAHDLIFQESSTSREAKL